MWALVEEKRSGCERKESLNGVRRPETRCPASPTDHALHLQRCTGNQLLQATLASGGSRAELSFALDDKQMVRRQPDRRCALSSNTDNIVTEKTANAPAAYYGASFNHKFVSDPEGCSLSGVQVSEYVTTDRDDFNQGRPTVALGRKIWTLTRENKLSEADPIWTEAGAGGLGASPVNRWPAVLDQNQLWYYRYSASDSWKLGPGTVIKLTLHGDRSRKETLKVTTTDHGVSREEPYRGPDVRMRE